jgi:hypothetical protein
MPIDRTPNVTGALDWPNDDRSELSMFGGFFRQRATGDEYGQELVWHLHALATLWGVKVATTETLTSPGETSTLTAQAAALARANPAVAIEQPALPRVSGNLLEDVRSICGVSFTEIGALFDVTGRAVAEWRRGGVPDNRKQLLNALRSTGLMLVGGLGPAGVRRWLLSGTPRRLDRMKRGRVAEVVAEAREFQFSPAT